MVRFTASGVVGGEWPEGAGGDDGSTMLVGLPSCLRDDPLEGVRWETLQ